MLQAIGTGFDLHEMDEDRLEDCMEKLKETSHAATPA